MQTMVKALRSPLGRARFVKNINKDRSKSTERTAGRAHDVTKINRALRMSIGEDASSVNAATHYKKDQ